MLGPKKYTMYTKPFGKIIENHNMSYHVYADDIQLYVTFKPTLHSHAEILPRLENCLSDVQMWMKHNILKLNDDKTKVIVFAPWRISLNQADHMQ